MSYNQNNSLLLKSIPHNNRFLNTNLATLNSSNMINLQNNNRKLSKPITVSTTTNLSTNLPTNCSSINTTNTTNNNSNSHSNGINSYQFQYTNSNYSSNSSFNQLSNLPSMNKNNTTPTFNFNRKYSSDYQQASMKFHC